MSATVKVGDRVEWTWMCFGRGHDEGCECAGIGTGTVVEVYTDPDVDEMAAVEIADGGGYMSVYDLDVLQVIPS